MVSLGCNYYSAQTKEGTLVYGSTTLTLEGTQSFVLTRFPRQCAILSMLELAEAGAILLSAWVLAKHTVFV